MRVTVEEEITPTLLPIGSRHQAKLIDVTFRDQFSERKNQTYTWAQFHFEIVKPDPAVGFEAIGKRVRGEVYGVMSTRTDNQFRLWAEALIGRDIPAGMELEIPGDLIDLMAEIEIGHEPDRKTEGKFWERVANVFPIADSAYGQAEVEPPF